MRLFSLLAAAGLAACSSAPARYLSEKANAALINDTHSRDEWSLTIDAAEDLVRILPTVNEGDWLGEGSAGEGPGSVTHGRLRFQGSWSGGKLEGQFLGFYRGLLLINGHAKDGIPVDGMLYQHVVFAPIFSESWTAEHIQFLRDQSGTHSLMAFSGIFEDGEPRRGRFGIVDDNYRVTSFVEGTSDPKRLFQGNYALFELGSIDYDKLDPEDSDYKLVRTGKYVDGLREGHWAGPKLDAIYRNGKREGFCRRRVGVRAATDEYDYAWLSANYEADKPLGSMRLSFDETAIEFQEFTPGPDFDSEIPTGWMLVQPRDGAPYMVLADRDGAAIAYTHKDMPAGTTLAGLKAGEQWLNLDDGARWHGCVKDGKPEGFGRRYGHHPFTFFEEGWFEAGEPSGYVVGVSYRDNPDHHPYFFYVWDDGVELSRADESSIYRAEEKAELDGMMADIRNEMHELALRMRPAEEQVWYGVAWQGKVFDPSGHEVAPIMKRAGDVSMGDIVCEEFRTEGGLSRAFVVIASLVSDDMGYTTIGYIGVKDTVLHTSDQKLTTFSRSNTGPFFNNVTTTCQVCGGSGSEAYIQATTSGSAEVTFSGELQATVTTRHTVTTYTEMFRTCTSCSGRGSFANWGLGS